MSGLAAFALGLCAQQALLGKTWAGASVLFEPASPVDPTTPTLAVYCGRGYAKVEGRDVLNASAHSTMRFEMFVPASTTAAGFTFSSDSAQALVFACLWRQIETIYLSDAGVWAELWRRCTLRIDTREATRDLFENEKGQKLAVAIEEWKLETLAEPEIGQPAQAFWLDFLAALTGAGGELAALAPLLAAQIQATPALLTQARSDAATIGANDDEFAAIGLGITPDFTPVNVGDAHALSLEQITVGIPPLEPAPGDPAVAGRALRDAEAFGWKWPHVGVFPPTPAAPGPTYPPADLIGELA